MRTACGAVVRRIADRFKPVWLGGFKTNLTASVRSIGPRTFCRLLPDSTPPLNSFRTAHMFFLEQPLGVSVGCFFSPVSKGSHYIAFAVFRLGGCLSTDRISSAGFCLEGCFVHCCLFCPRLTHFRQFFPALGGVALIDRISPCLSSFSKGLLVDGCCMF